MCSVAKKGLDGRQVTWSADDQDLADAAGHEGPDRVVDHRLVIDGEELLAHALRGRVEATPTTAGEHDPPHEPAAVAVCSRARATCQITVALRASANWCCGA